MRLRSWIVPIATIISLLLVIFGSLWSQRPVIEYGMLNYPETFDSQFVPMNVVLRIKNTGKTYGKLNLVLRVENAKITLEKYEQNMLNNGTRLEINYDIQSEMNTYDEHEVKIEPFNNAEYFSLDLSIENLSDMSIPNGIIAKFLEPHGIITYLEYIRTVNTTYRLSVWNS